MRPLPIVRAQARAHTNRALCPNDRALCPNANPLILRYNPAIGHNARMRPTCLDRHMQTFAYLNNQINALRQWGWGRAFRLLGMRIAVILP